MDVCMHLLAGHYYNSYINTTDNRHEHLSILGRLVPPRIHIHPTSENSDITLMSWNLIQDASSVLGRLLYEIPRPLYGLRLVV
jgi:hypothetical protein